MKVINLHGGPDPGKSTTAAMHELTLCPACGALPCDQGAALPVEALEWFGSQRNLELYFHSPVYCDDDDQAEEWRVARKSGSINDREWTVIGNGETPVEAIVAAQRAPSNPRTNHDPD